MDISVIILLLGIAVVIAIIIFLERYFAHKPRGNSETSAGTANGRDGVYLPKSSGNAAKNDDNRFNASISIFALRLIGWVILLGGTITCIDLWPVSNGRDIPSILYLIPLYHLFGGIIFGTLFIAGAAALEALSRIANK